MNKHRLFITLLLIAVAAQVTLADEIKIVGQNVQNFFYSLDRGRTQGNSVQKSNYNTVEGRTAKLNAIIETLSVYEADIYAFNEVEVKVAGTPDNEDALKLLAQAMSTKTGKTYEAVSDDQTYNLSDDATGLIRSGFIYNTATIETVGDNISTAVGYTSLYPAMMRMQTFKSKASGEAFTLSMNHFKASTSNYEDDVNKREQNSIALLKGLDQATQDPDILIMGDLNTEISELCLKNLQYAGYEEQILKRDPNAYTHWYDSGSLIDHVFANSTMAAQVTDAHVEYVANKHSHEYILGGDWRDAYSDHDPYVVTLNLQAQPEAKYGFKKATTVTAGEKYLLVVPLNTLSIAETLPLTGSYYGYQTMTPVTETNGVIEMTHLKNTFIFEDAGEGKYYLKDHYGRYLYQSPYNSTYSYQTSVGARQYFSDTHYTLTLQDDGTFRIENNTSQYYLIAQYYTNAYTFSWRTWKNLNSNQFRPWLYEYDPNATATGISTVSHYSQPTVTRKVMEQGRIIIIGSDGRKYTMEGILLR